MHEKQAAGIQKEMLIKGRQQEKWFANTQLIPGKMRLQCHKEGRRKWYIPRSKMRTYRERNLYQPHKE